jgi:hypothetical protein
LDDAPPAPLDLTLDSFTPNPSTDLFMSAGDQLDISIHDSADGLVTEIHDLTTGQSGFDDGERRQRVRAGQLRPDRVDVHADALRVPPHVLHV